MIEVEKLDKVGQKKDNLYFRLNGRSNGYAYRYSKRNKKQ